MLPRPPSPPLFPYTTLFRSTDEVIDSRPIRGGNITELNHGPEQHPPRHRPSRDRKSTRLNSSHVAISYAVFCLKKKKIYKPQLSIDKIQIPSHNKLTFTGRV